MTVAASLFRFEDSYAREVNPGVEIGVNPDSHPWADAPDGWRAAR